MRTLAWSRRSVCGMLAAGLVAPFVNAQAPRGVAASRQAAAQVAPPAKLPQEVYGAAVVSIVDKIYVFGGRYGSGRMLLSPRDFDGMQAYDAASNAWARQPSPYKFLGANSVLTRQDGRLFVLAGPNGQLYDPTTGERTPVARAEGQGMVRGVVEVGGRFFVVSEDAVAGRDRQRGFLHRVDEYEPASDSWTPRTTFTLTDATTDVRVARGADRTLLVFRTWPGGGGGYTGTLDAYHVDNDTWTPKSPMPTPRWAVAITRSGGRVHVIGGDRGERKSVGLNEAYDPATDTWTTMASMPIARFSAGAATLPDGTIYVVGGLAVRPQPSVPSGQEEFTTAAVERYDPAMDAWASSGG